MSGYPLCHLLGLDRETLTEIEREIRGGEFDGYRAHGDGWAVDQLVWCGRIIVDRING